MNVLFFTEICPFPVNGGERIRSYGLIKILSKIGFRIYAVIRNDENVDLSEYSISNVDFIVNDSIESKLSKLLRLSYFVQDERVLKIFNDIIGRKKIDLVFLDYGFVGNYISYFKKKGLPVLLGTHNAQSDLTMQMPISGAFEFIRKIQNIFMQKMHERIFFPKADGVIVVSELDARYHRKFIENKKIYIVPNFLDETIYKNEEEKEDYFVMTANFNAYMNYEGLKWFIENVWNEEVDAVCKVVLVGKGSKEALSSIQKKSKYKNYKGISAIGMVKDILPYICKSKAVLIPLLHGSGTRLKCLEAMALQTSIIGTKKGVEGIESGFINIANTENDFRECICVFERCKYNENMLYEEFEKKYSMKSNMHMMKTITERVAYGKSF